MREIQYCLCLAEYYLTEASPPQPRLAIQCLTASLNCLDASASEKSFAHFRLALLYLKYTENLNHVFTNLDKSIEFGHANINAYNEQWKHAEANQTTKPKIHHPDSIVKFCPAELYAEAIHLYVGLSLPKNLLQSQAVHIESVEKSKKLLQTGLNDLATCVAWAGSKLGSWQVKLALQMATTLFKESDYETAKEFINYGIEMAKSNALEYFWAMFSLAKAMISVSQFNIQDIDADSFKKLISEVETALSQPVGSVHDCVNMNLSNVPELPQLNLKIYIAILKSGLALRSGNYKDSKSCLRVLNELYKKYPPSTGGIF